MFLHFAKHYAHHLEFKLFWHYVHPKPVPIDYYYMCYVGCSNIVSK